MWTSEKLEDWKAASGKTWAEMAHDLGVGERYLRKIVSGERPGKMILERAEKTERAATAREAVSLLQQETGKTRAQIAQDLGVGERYLRKIVSGERSGLPAVEKLFGEARRQAVETPTTRFFFKDMATDRIGKILSDLMNTQFRGLAKREINRIALNYIGELDEEMQNEAWRLAKDLYEGKRMTVTA